VPETRDAKTFVLRPARSWRGHRAGQHTTLTVEIGGVRVRRCYSLSSAPGERDVCITVKRNPAGRQSSWLHDHLRRGDIVRLSPAAGDFVLPTPTPPKLLFVSGGSGITPVMAMLRDLSRRRAMTDVLVMHYARSRDDVIFAAELAALDVRHAALGVRVVVDGFNEERLSLAAPDFAERATFLCGPVGLMARAERMWAGAGATAHLRQERFAAPPPAHHGGDAVTIALSDSARTLAATAGGTLLDQLERAGERPPHGCRQGICHTCSCRKRRGTVENLTTRAISSEPDELIQLCISVARSDVVLDL
jgi:ferredoxin-NADP reductase